ncbi:hypothetical protein OVA24_12240 [Luteolibacter sp. SL250]|uniref:hypothetical protein n=1 Tax=Luteolibacter sp. SL250 TaxID=2995170 RepID=UPI0022718934|nr:hypothetical protein [Luteolibacter sp. SL250]WAC18008.1 hypothetical protein OVA24_12240 [Luteolibacter sp. SL250]
MHQKSDIRRTMIRVLLTCKAAAWALCALPAAGAEQPFRIEVVDRENGWPVPLVELRTTHHLSIFTDNAGLAAIDEPDLFGREIWLGVSSDGYQVKADGFGSAGVRVQVERGKKARVEVERTMVAKRLGRLTGAGLFNHLEKLGETAPIGESGVMGSDSVLLSRYRDRLFWLWGDTSIPEYPLGNFNSTAATSPLLPLAKFQPPLALRYDYLKTDGKLRGVSPLEGPGPTWLGAMTSVKDRSGSERLVATYSKIENHLDEYDVGLCAFDDERGIFTSVHRIWKKGDGKKPLIPRGHPFPWKDQDGSDWLLFGDPFPSMKCPATYEGWEDPSKWQEIPAPSSPRDAGENEITPHRGSVCWNAHRQRWITIFTQNHGKPSGFGEIWYAEADSPLGPWSTAVKVLSHRNYTFYNPRIQHELTAPDAPFILFEGTYTAEFADKAAATPRFNYNQILYRLDLDDPKLVPARK